MYLLLPIACMVVGDDGVCDHFLSFSLHHKKNTNILRLKRYDSLSKFEPQIAHKRGNGSVSKCDPWMAHKGYVTFGWLLPSLSRLRL